LALQAICGNWVAGRKPNVQVDIWRWRNFVVFHRMGLSICTGRLSAMMGFVPFLIGFARELHPPVMQRPSSDNGASLWKSLHADCRDWRRFAPNSEQAKKACPARGARLTAQKPAASVVCTGLPIRPGVALLGQWLSEAIKA
jgi:hypothetical protein